MVRSSNARSSGVKTTGVGPKRFSAGTNYAELLKQSESSQYDGEREQVR